MSDAPERIWADKKMEPTLADMRIGTHWDAPHRFAKVEYIRADLHAARIKALEGAGDALADAMEHGRMSSDLVTAWDAVRAALAAGETR
jgi:hypothetical protein